MKTEEKLVKVVFFFSNFYSALEDGKFKLKENKYWKI